MKISFKKRRLPFLLAVIVLLILLHITGIIRPVENFFISLLSPVQKTFYQLATKINVALKKDINLDNTIIENEKLKRELIDALRENNELRSLKDENKNLREILDFKESENYNLIIANITGRSIDYTSNQLIIDKGKNDGIKSGFPVISPGGVLIGKISNTEDNFAFIQLLTDKKSKLSVKINNDQNTRGLVESELGISLKMNYILQNMPIAENDTVVTSGSDNYIPSNLLIGKVQKLYEEPNELFKQADIEPLVDNNELLFVGVIMP